MERHVLLPAPNVYYYPHNFVLLPAQFCTITRTEYVLLPASRAYIVNNFNGLQRLNSLLNLLKRSLKRVEELWINVRFRGPFEKKRFLIILREEDFEE